MTSSGFSTLPQHAWDTVLQHTNLFLCLTGSTYSVMRREILVPAGKLFSEVRLLLHEELKGEVDAFSRVLEAIAAGQPHRPAFCSAAVSL